MRTFKCECGARIFFENTLCLTCGRELGFLPNAGSMSAIEPSRRGYRALWDGGLYEKCKNNVDEGVCNWLVSKEETNDLCQACRLNRVIPDLTQEEVRKLWSNVEIAKRRLLYSLNELELPVIPQSESSVGLAFDIKADTPDNRVLTGHADGLITLNLAEADPVLREKTRLEMDERYRTLLGHFRHESGHYYWDLLVRDSSWLEPYRELFGDERQDYAAALKNHYGDPSNDWATDFISAYASSHPWEDWAETWAHFLHIVDTLETAGECGFSAIRVGEEIAVDELDELMDDWHDLTIALNAMNRSMGMPDPYPFHLTPKVKQKLAFVRNVVVEAKVRVADGSLATAVST
jgi:hypothetical protein